MTYTIGVFSKKVGLSIDTLRYYEKELLIIPNRNDINRRVYDDADITWIEFIKRLKKTGMPIKDMKHYAALRYQGDGTIEERMALLYEQLGVLLKQREGIDASIQFLTDKIHVYKEMLKKNK